MGKDLQIKSPAAWAKQGLIVAAALIASVAVVAPFYFAHKEVTPPGSPSRAIQTHDLAQHLAVMEQFDKVLRSGVLYPRWLPDVNKGYGLAWSNFYPPGLYYLTSLIHLVVSDWMKTLFVVSVLGLTASGMTLYLLARQFYGTLASAVAALFYMTGPYHVLDLYWRGAMPEFIGFILAPLIVYFVVKLGSEGKARYYAGLGFFHGLFLMTHIPVAFLMTYALAFYALVWAAREKDWRIVLRVALGISIALMFSAIYWVPSFLELKYAAEPFSSIFPYHSSYITLLQDGDSFRTVVNESFAVQALALLAAIAVLYWVRRSAGEPRSGIGSEKEGDLQTGLWSMMGVVTVFMCTSLSIYVSRLLPKIDIASFAWRWLVLVALFVSLVVAAAIERLRVQNNSNVIQVWAGRAGITAVLLLNIWITLHGVIGGALGHSAFNPPPDYVESGFIPRGSPANPNDLPETADVVILPRQNAVFEVSHWDPAYREVHVSVSQPSQIRLKTYNFRGWVARVDGEPTPIQSDSDGAQLIDIASGIHNIQVSFDTTGPRVVGTLFSAMGLITIIGLSFRHRIPKRISTQPGATSSEFEGQQGGAASIITATRLPGGMKRFTAISIALVVGIAVIVMTMSRFNSGTGSPGNVKTQPVTPSAPQVGSGTPQAGDNEVRLYLPGRDSVMLATDEAAWDELIGALTKRDEPTLEALVASGRVLKVAPDSRARRVQANTGRLKVRILEGPYMMKEGWVGERWIR